MDTFDVLVVGGGISGGLPAATYLQKAGLDVAVIEARPERSCSDSSRADRFTAREHAIKR